jgi:hypothetical protein
VTYELSYLTYSLIFLIVWGILFAIRKDIRGKILLASLVVTPMGPISEIWFLRDYWQRPTITGYAISIEDAIFAFAIGGIGFSIYKIMFNVIVVPSQTCPQRKWLILLFPAIVLAYMVFFTNWLRINSIFSSSFAFVTFVALVWWLRPDLIKPSVITGILLLLLFLAIYQIMQVLFPGVLLKWCLGCNPSGVRILGVNIEELLWDFSWGLVGGIAYEATTGKVFQNLKSKRRAVDRRTDLTIHSSFDAESPNRDNQTSLFGRFMASSSEDVLSIRLIRELSYGLSRFVRRKVSRRFVMLLLMLFPLVINLLLYPLGYFCQDAALAWLVYYIILNYCLLEFPWTTWAKLVRISDSIDDLLETPADKQALIWWMKQRLQMRLQLILSVVGGIGSIIAVRIVANFLPEQIIGFCVASYVSVFMTGALGINAVYWLWAIPFLIYRLYEFPSLHVTWNSPIRTTGIRELSRLLGFSAILTAIGVTLCYSSALGLLCDSRGNIFLVD